MKYKKIILLAFVIIPFSAFSQTDSILKYPSSKAFMVEINFNPFGSENIISFDNVQAKYWINNKTALRLGLEVNYSRNSVSVDDYKITEVNKNTFDEQSLLYGIKPGIEFRPLKTSKVSPYFGFEFSYRNKSSSAEYDDHESTYSDPNYIERTIVTGAWREYEKVDIYGNIRAIYTTEQAFNSLGGNLILGTDFFFIKNIYFGIEIGLGYEKTRYNQVEIDISTEDIIETFPSSTSNDFGFYFNNSIRLGIWF